MTLPLVRTLICAASFVALFEGVEAQSFPSVSVSIPSVSIPSVSVSIPSVSISIPSVSVSIPSVSLPSISIPLPTRYPGIDLGCIGVCTADAALNNGCLTAANLLCICKSDSYWTATLDCLYGNCTAQDVELATNIQQDQCLFEDYIPNSVSLSSAVSRFLVAESSIISRDSSILSSLSSEYRTEGTSLSSAFASYASSLSSALSSEAASIAGIPQTDVAASSTSTSAPSSTANAAAGIVPERFYHVGSSLLVVFMSIVLGAGLVL